MSMLSDIRWYPLPLRTLLGTSMVTNNLYYPIGNPVERATRIVKLQNFTDQYVFFSVDGTTAFDIMPSGGFFVIDIAANDSFQNGLYCDGRTQFWASSDITPTTGSVYVTAIASTR